MPSLYPQALDALTNPSSIDPIRGGHAAQHSNANDAIEALQAYIGVMGSTDAASLGFRVSVLETNTSADGIRAIAADQDTVQIYDFDALVTTNLGA